MEFKVTGAFKRTVITTVNVNVLITIHVINTCPFLFVCLGINSE